MTTLVCVKVGPRYGPEYVNRLRDSLFRNGLAGARVVCFTDDTRGLRGDIDCRSLHPDIPPSWWAKINLFNWKRHKLRDRLLYFDLDMVVTGNLRPLLRYRRRFLTAHRFDDDRRLGSTVMSIPPGYGQFVWDKFITNMEHVMKQSKYAREGDQRFVQAALEHAGEPQPEKVQKLWPGLLRSYKLHLRPNGGELPAGTGVVSFHGKPDPGEVPERWVRKHWREDHEAPVDAPA